MLTRAEIILIKVTTKLSLADCGGQEAAAEASGRIKRHQSFSEYASPKYQDRIISVDTALEMDRFSENPRFARLFAELSGHVLFRLPDVGRLGVGLGRATAKAFKETADVFSKLGDAWDDGVITPEEAAAVHTEIEEAIARLVALDAAVCARAEECGE